MRWGVFNRALSCIMLQFSRIIYSCNSCWCTFHVSSCKNKAVSLSLFLVILHPRIHCCKQHLPGSFNRVKCPGWAKHVNHKKNYDMEPYKKNRSWCCFGFYGAMPWPVYDFHGIIELCGPIMVSMSSYYDQFMNFMFFLKKIQTHDFQISLIITVSSS